MTITYSEDADIIAEDPFAADYLPASDAGDFDRVRVQAQPELLPRLSRRNPPVTSSDLSDSSELLHCEVTFVLHFLYRDAATRTGDDLLWKKSEYWQKAAEAEVNSAQLSVGENVRSVQGSSAPVWRC
jgi:hypothetical protein